MGISDTDTEGGICLGSSTGLGAIGGSNKDKYPRLKGFLSLRFRLLAIFFGCGYLYGSVLSSGLGEKLGFDGGTHSRGLTIHHESDTAAAVGIVTLNFFFFYL